MIKNSMLQEVTDKSRYIGPEVGDRLTSELLRRTLADVQRDEAEAISLLVRLLDRVRETSITAPLEDISKVVNEWQHRPPNAIVCDLMKIDEQFEDTCQGRAKK